MKSAKYFLILVFGTLLVIACNKKQRTGDAPTQRPSGAGQQQPVPPPPGPSTEPDMPRSGNDPSGTTTSAPNTSASRPIESKREEVSQNLGTFKGSTPSANIAKVVAINMQITDDGAELALITQDKNKTDREILVSDKKLTPGGDSQRLKSVTFKSGTSAEARCLKTCSHVVAHIKKDGIGEVHALFQTSDGSYAHLRQLMGYEENVLAKAVLARSQIIENAVSLSEDLATASLVSAELKAESLALSEEIYLITKLSVLGTKIEWGLNAEQLKLLPTKLQKLKASAQTLKSEPLVKFFHEAETRLSELIRLTLTTQQLSQ